MVNVKPGQLLSGISKSGTSTLIVTNSESAKYHKCLCDDSIKERDILFIVARFGSYYYAITSNKQPRWIVSE